MSDTDEDLLTVDRRDRCSDRPAGWSYREQCLRHMLEAFDNEDWIELGCES